MQWLALTYLLSIGTMQYDLKLPRDNGYFFTPEKTITTTLGFEALIAEHVFIGANVETWEQMDSIKAFWPMESLYTFNAGIRWNGLEIGFKHECDHPTLSNDIIKGYYTAQSSWYLSYKGTLKIF